MYEKRATPKGPPRSLLVPIGVPYSQPPPLPPLLFEGGVGGEFKSHNNSPLHRAVADFATKTIFRKVVILIQICVT